MPTLLVFIYKNFYKFFNSLWLNLDNFAILKGFKNNVVYILNKKVDRRLFGFLISLLLGLRVCLGNKIEFENPFWIMGGCSMILLFFLVVGLLFKKSLSYLNTIHLWLNLILNFIIKINLTLIIISVSLVGFWVILVYLDTFKACNGCLGIKGESYSLLIRLYFFSTLFAGYAASNILERFLGEVGKNIILFLIWPASWYFNNHFGLEQLPYVRYVMFQGEGPWLFLPFKLFYENYAFLGVIQFSAGCAIYSFPHLLSNGLKNILSLLREIHDYPNIKIIFFFAIFFYSKEKSYDDPADAT